MGTETLFCPTCQKNVIASLRINWLIFIILLILGIVLGIIYLVYCFMSSSHRKCSICGCKTLMPPQAEKIKE